MAFTKSQTTFDLGLGLEDTHVLVTGGCGLIGKIVANAFIAAGCNVTIIDITNECPFDQEDPTILYQEADITSTEQMEQAFAAAQKKFGPIECCIALASLDLSVLQQSESLADANPADWQRVLDVNVHGTFLTSHLWLKSIRSAVADPVKASQLRNVSLVIMGSEAGRFGVRTMAAYAAGKAAVQYGLLRSLAQDAPRVYPSARVNAIAPGAVDTDRFKVEVSQFGEEFRYRESEATVPSAKPVSPEHVARTILFLASERYSGSVHGQLIPIDGGKTGGLVWTQDEIAHKKRSTQSPEA